MLLRLKSALHSFPRWEHLESIVDRWELLRPATGGRDRCDARERSAADPVPLDQELLLVQNIFLQPAAPQRKVVLFGEVEPHHGGAAVCGGAAKVLARSGASVCMVDADTRTSSLHLRFHAPLTHGLVDVLRDDAAVRDAAHQVGTNLWLLGAGSETADPRPLFAADRLRVLYKKLRDEFDHVLINAPPFSQCAEAMLLSQLSDGVVLVVEAHKTHRERARTITENLTSAEVPLLGVVLNNRTFPIPDVLYRKL